MFKVNNKETRTMNKILTHTRMTTENNTGLSAANNLQINFFLRKATQLS